MGNREFLRFARRNVRRDGVLETMPAWRPDIQPAVRGITPASHETQSAKRVTNAGTTAASGLVPGV